ncbi:hypothetical protein B0T16DRAFT_418300 [Cercophora newfieldiana]|uniref:Uncharacterized protein n=1 Tax=Cercophora newfieldiana TaxID=92897 RepID=A0AA40CJH4_9PEZI|nr:hypothetical protein B0T16DRAFT_418300 [Cercophora newfieldiana]
MGTSKFTFPIPGRRSKPAPIPPPVTTAPRTKAEKLLGTGDVVDDHTKLSPEPRWGWDARSNSGISIAVSDTTVSHSGQVGTGLGIVQEDIASGSPARRGQWEEESAIIPPVVHPGGQDGVTDASSLRRRQSSSTITSYYDKSKLPLSISQQTSNSAMAKGLPTKASLLLDIEGVYAEPPTKPKKKKPAMLDLTGLLNRQRSSKFLRPETYKGLVLGPDLITKSPSIMSLSPDATPPPISQRTERHLRKKLTKESLREASPVPEPLRQSPAAARPTLRSRGEDRGHRPTKSTVDLMNLYDHYEQRSFADVLEEHAEISENSDSVGQLPTYPTPPTSSHNGFLAPQQLNGTRMAIPAKHAALMGSTHDVSLMGTSPSSLVSPPTDTASVSSRHTRTSKASKRTDRSLTDLDLQQNSVLSLSSDSEDDGYEASSKSSLAIPALSLSDGQASPTSPRSAISQRSAATAPQEGNRGKLPKRTSFATQPQFLPIPEGAPAANLPPINARTSSLTPNAIAKKQAQLLHQTSRLSIGTTSTGRTVSGGTIQGTKVGGGSPPRQPGWTAGINGCDDFPAPPANHGHRFPITAQSPEQPTPPLSPTSVDFYLQSHRSSKVAFDIDTRSISSVRSLGSLSKGVRRGSAASSHHDSSSGRFMAVTRQEEMLLAALRQKRALMRENMTPGAGLDENIDREGEELQRQYTNGSSSGISRQSSMSTMRTVDASGFGPLSARPHQPQIRVSSSSSDLRRSEKVVREQILLMMDRPSDESTGLETAEPSPDLDGFLGFDDSFDFPIPDRRGRIGSVDSASGSSPKMRKTTPSPAASGLRTVPPAKEALLRRDADQASLRSGSRRGSDKENPDRILEDPREEEEDTGVPRPDSPISPMDFPVPTSMTRKKQVRLSAVGNYKPNIEAGWWNDSG